MRDSSPSRSTKPLWHAAERATSTVYAPRTTTGASPADANVLSGHHILPRRQTLTYSPGYRCHRLPVRTVQSAVSCRRNYVSTGGWTLQPVRGRCAQGVSPTHANVPSAPATAIRSLIVGAACPAQGAESLFVIYTNFIRSACRSGVVGKPQLALG